MTIVIIIAVRNHAKQANSTSITYHILYKTYTNTEQCLEALCYQVTRDALHT